MKADIELLRADIRSELEKIAKLNEEFTPFKGTLDLGSGDVSNAEKIMIGYIMHNFYNGCENIFRSIARFFENELDGTAWHRDLLKRMTLEIRGFRPRVITDDLYAFLDDFRGFQHKFRHSYSFELDWEREKVVAAKFSSSLEMLRRDVGKFLENLDMIEEGGDT
ncbi:MAG: antitoxin [Deltaproteobacteria bacterium]|nr:antitoxin [Deltaproteobacteria bacterium]